MSDLGEAVKETGRGLVQAGVNVANIPASVADAVTSAAAWAGGKLGIGYGTAMNPATTGAAVSYGLLTRAYESEPFRNAMLRMANTPRGSTAFEKAMQQAQKAINALTQGAKSDALSE